MPTFPPPPVPDASAASPADQPRLYGEATAMFGPALGRLAAAYEQDLHRRQDLLQEIHFALWRSLTAFHGACTLRTWVYRVAHNVATSHIMRDRHRGRLFVGLDALDDSPAALGEDAPAARLAEQLDAERQRARLAALIEQLGAHDRQLVVLYLEGLDAAAIGDVTGLSAGNVATKIHRIKRVLAQRVLAERAPARSASADGRTGPRHVPAQSEVTHDR
jgi:RNA polymerase sigma-70 factor (ECF subfamily)